MYTLLVSSSPSLQAHLSGALSSFVETVVNIEPLLSGSRLQAGDIVWIDADNQDHAYIESMCRGQFGAARVIVLSGVPDDRSAVRWLGCGAAGFVHAFSSPATLRQTLTVVESGGVWIGVGLMQQLCSRFGQLSGSEQEQSYPDELTLREKEVVGQLQLGKNNKQIAKELNITERTVKAHLSAIFIKLQVTDRVQLLLKLATGLKAGS